MRRHSPNTINHTDCTCRTTAGGRNRYARAVRHATGAASGYKANGVQPNRAAQSRCESGSGALFSFHPIGSDAATTGPRSGGTALRPPGRSTVPHPFFLSYGSPEDQTTPPPHGAVRRSSGVRAVRYRPNDFSAGWRNVESPLGADASAVPPCTAERPIFRIGEQPPRYTVQSRICAVHLSSRLRTTIPPREPA